ncbi:MAG: AzlD domain-containing protein [Clostridia bacterium]|nr:AzlD domain-containing protein [Clostridia bacterium]
MNETLYMVLLVIVMAGVTYLIRMVPFVFFRKKIKSRFINSLLYYIPYAVLSAMTFPAIFFSTGNVLTACIGTAVALIAAISKRSLVTVAICAVLAVLLFSFIL